MPNILKLLFSPAGRIGRRDYLIGLVGLIAIFWLYGVLLKFLGGSLAGFFAVLALPFVILQIAYSVYGKRLHDIGRTLWPLTGIISLILLAMFVVMLVYDGAEYFAAYGEYSRKNLAPAEISERLNAEFKLRQQEGETVLGWVVSSITLAFTLWLALAKSQAGQNAYGKPTTK